jgi:collagen triple helix repeat protein
MLKRKLKEPFGKAGLSVAILALVFALAGGAYAANNSATASKAGKPGPRGKTGKTGPAGAPGAIGPAGVPGASGAPGKNGTNGKNGEEGSPWTAGGTLPSGKTETGVFAISPSAEGPEVAPISFTLPLAHSLSGEGCEEEPATRTKQCQVHFISQRGEEEVWNEAHETTGHFPQTNCLGDASAPTAKPGNLCVYQAENHLALFGLAFRAINGFGSTPGASTAGAYLRFEAGEASASFATGTWAVTAP